jgi:hypothetical protein
MSDSDHADAAGAPALIVAHEFPARPGARATDTLAYSASKVGRETADAVTRRMFNAIVMNITYGHAERLSAEYSPTQAFVVGAFTMFAVYMADAVVGPGAPLPRARQPMHAEFVEELVASAKVAAFTLMFVTMSGLLRAAFPSPPATAATALWLGELPWGLVALSAVVLVGVRRLAAAAEAGMAPR